MNRTSALNMINHGIRVSKKMKLPPLAMVILDHRSKVKAAICDDGVGTLRYDIALGKASAALGLGFGTREFHTLVKNGVLPEMFANCINGAAQGHFIPLPGGVLIMNAQQELVGAIGISGANSDQDETVALHMIESENLRALL